MRDEGRGGPRAVLFDVVGTLIHPNPPVAKAYSTACRRHGGEMDEQTLALRFSVALRAEDWTGPTNEGVERSRWRRVAAEVFNDFGGDFNALFDDLWGYFGDSRNWSVYSDVLETWRIIEESGILIGLASNFDTRLIDVARDLEPLNRANRVFCSSELGYSKPSPEFFRIAQQELGLGPNEILLVGDDWNNDIEGARSAGWHAVHIDRTGNQGEGIQSLQEILQLVH